MVHMEKIDEKAKGVFRNVGDEGGGGGAGREEIIIGEGDLMDELKQSTTNANNERK